MRHIESRIQVSCVTWFRLQYPKMARLLFAVPNGGMRGKVEASIMKAEGVVAGVADLLLMVPTSAHHGLCIEMKTAKGRQQESQKSWQEAVEGQGYKYVICRSLDDFMEQIRAYLEGI